MTSSLRLLTLSLCCLIAACSEKEKAWTIAAADPATLRTTASGPVIGGEGRYGSHAWLGIPFAAPPVGELRWKAPRPPAPWKEPLPALTPSNGCPQFASAIGGLTDAPMGTPTGNEDCLYLNIRAPKFAADHVPKGKDRLPVMFWIHGGGNSIGSAQMFEGGHIASKEGVIVVTTQYRLGPLGWFRQKSLRTGAQDAVERSGNFGTLDLVRGLQWVRDNISAFGGDPDNVTVFGESAGGADTFTMLLSPQAKGLFHRAIVESGGLSDVTADDAENLTDDATPGHKNSADEVALRLLAKAGLAQDRATAKAKLASMTDSDLATFLRSKSPSEILDSYVFDRRLGMIDMPLVFHDGVVLPSGDWTEQFATQDWNRVPVILGTNHDEFKLFMAINPQHVRRVLGLFPRLNNEQNYEATAEYISRSWKAGGVDLPAAAMKRSGASDVYAYRFDWHGEPTVAGADLGKILGAAHGFEMPFVFGHFDLGPLAKRLFDEDTRLDREKLSEQMMSYWAQFARTGSPSRGRGDDLLPWTAWDASAPEKPKYVVLDSPSEGGLHMASETQTRERLYADIDADPRLPTQREKCEIFRALVGFTHGLTRETYPHAGRNGCADYPLAEYPWKSK